MLSLDNLVDVFSKTKHTKMFDLVVFVSLQNLHLAVYNEASLLSTKRGIGRVLCQHLLSSQKNVGAHTVTSDDASSCGEASAGDEDRQPQ
jgi:hypothetical protein